ncbi:MAG: Crp/Fnr family transcriptional regulator [Desulfobacula sp.]|nr:Crp/Fnr family transcriptional regulator [Desulfobacula sp.]MBT3483947.1 Crp/Fnr family transcriptional regulator [Desulfobacula sp.]MBT3803866.1 Crp/Fnr family transcriptional regulator [Desulfobacula sp.]MBT4023811.1 Crp/Fnr family transcriptional regulator [Desulfobacula sp.]MBT4197629.1 Crp/Fnr family transcriptional regulator [Desulfobacula sp.]
MGELYFIKKLNSIPLFSGLAQEHLEKIASIASTLKFDKGEIIFHEGDKGNGFYMVEKGKIKVFKLSYEGKEQILHIYGPGNTFGEVPVFEGKNFPASSMALEKSVILFLPRDKFVDLITATPGLGMIMLADLSKRLRDFTMQIENLSLKEVPARLAAYILTLSKEQQNKTQVTLPISKAQLSNLIGTTPETVSRILKKMMESSFIEVQTKTILIKDFEGLINLSESGSLS